MEIRNPTSFDARQAQQPQGNVALVKWPKVEVKAGRQKTITVALGGRVM